MIWRPRRHTSGCLQAGEPEKPVVWAQSESESLRTRETNNVTLSLNLKTQELEEIAGRWDWCEPQNPKAREPRVLISKEKKGMLAPEDRAEFTLY